MRSTKLLAIITSASNSMNIEFDEIKQFRMIYTFFLSYNVWKHVRYPSLISRHPHSYHPGWRLMRLGYRTCFHTLYDENIYIYIYIYIYNHCNLYSILIKLFYIFFQRVEIRSMFWATKWRLVIDVQKCPLRKCSELQPA